MVRKRDRFWDYAKKEDGKFTCEFCNKTFPGGVARVKSHLSGIRGGGIEICTGVSEDVRVAAAEAISANPHKRAKAEECSVKTEETLPKILISKDGALLDKLLAKFILLNDLDIDIMQRPSFINYVNAVAEHGSNYRLPCCSVVKTKLVPDLKKEIGEQVANVKKSWVRTGCTLISAISCDEDRCFINFFAYSAEGMVLLKTLEIPKDELTTCALLWEANEQGDTLYSIFQERGCIVQYITNTAQKLRNEDIFISNYPNLYQTNCVAFEIHALFKDIYNNIRWIRKVFDQAKAVVAKVRGHDGILLSMKQSTNNWELKQSSTTEFYSNYYMLQSIMGIEKKLQLLVSSPKWLSLGFEKDESGVEVGEILRSSEFWSEGKEVLHALEPIFQVLCLVDSYGATSGFLYAAVGLAEEAIRKIYETDVHKYQRLWAFFKLRKSNIIHPIHAAAAFLNPAYFCSEKFKENNAMKQGMDFILEKLVGGAEKAKFVQDMLLYRSKVPKLFNCTAMTMLQTSHPCDWWDFCGDDLPVLKKYAIQILSQPCSTSFCRPTLSALKTAQTEKTMLFTPAMKDDYLYLRTNALLMENFNTMKEKIKKPLDLEKLGELPDCTEFINENFTHDLSNEGKDPLSDGKLDCWFALSREDGESENDLRLHFINELPLSLVKGNEVKGEGGAPIHVVLVDSRTGSVVQSGCPSKLELMVTVIGGDFDGEAGKNWTREFFEWHENKIMGQEGKMPLLNGDLSVLLDEGMGTLGAITFNDVSSWTRSGKFRLGVKTKGGYCEGIRVYEGTSNAFAVEDGKSFKFRHLMTLYYMLLCSFFLAFAVEDVEL